MPLNIAFNIVCLLLSHVGAFHLSITPLPWRKESFDYDLVVIGAGEHITCFIFFVCMKVRVSLFSSAVRYILMSWFHFFFQPGASGLFAAGTASSIGCKTLLIEKAYSNTHNTTPRVEFNLGGDCTNAACVPSKSVRSIAKLAAASRTINGISEEVIGHDVSNWLQLARQQADHAVSKVRGREDPSRMAGVPNLDLEFVSDCHFISDKEMKLTCYDNSTWLESETIITNTNNATMMKDRTIRSKKFIVATGASPILPKDLANAATAAGVPYYTYRDMLRPGQSDLLLKSSVKNVIIVGGGATACELGQTLSRLAGEDVTISMVAPALLPTEDFTLQNAAMKILDNDNCKMYLGSRAVGVAKSGQGALLVLDNNLSIPVDCILFCTGRSPEASLKSLQLEKAGIAWSAENGVSVNSYLRSHTAGHVYAAGDCASAVHPRDRRAIHAGWLGFNAVRNACAPWFLRSPATHPFVPRVTYTDPEIASAGMSTRECIQKFGANGYDSLLVPESGSDRADQESRERETKSNFIEMRAEKISGRVLGASACGPAAAEIINEVCLCLSKRLTVRDLARTLHAYPSHGYLLYRVSMAVATQKISGLLAGCGIFGRFLAGIIRMIERLKRVFKFSWLPWNNRALQKRYEWQAAGSAKALILQSDGESPSLASFLDAYNNETMRHQIVNGSNLVHAGRENFIEWVSSK